MDTNKKQKVHRIIEQVEEQLQRIREERAKRLRGEPYLTEDQVRVEVAIKYMRPETCRAASCRNFPARKLLNAQTLLISDLIH